LRDKELELEEVEALHSPGGAGEGGIKGEESEEEGRGVGVGGVVVLRMLNSRSCKHADGFLMGLQKHKLTVVAAKGAVNGRHHDVRDRVTVTIISTVVANLVSSSLIEQIINIVRH